MEASLKKASDVVATLLNRRPGGGGGHIEAPREPELPRDWPERLPFRKRPKPYSRAIAWTPGDTTTRPDRRRPYELFVSQSVLRQVRGHLLTARSGEPYGFLLGQVVYCPWSDAPYIVIDAVRRESQDLPPANDVDRFRHAWVAATRDARHRRGEVIGWYHRHGVLGLRLSEWDLHLQEEFFPEAWHCALIIASSSRGIVGGFIQRSPRARLFRKGLAVFHELVDLDAKLVEGRKPSFVDWENYAAGEPVSVLQAKWPAPRTRLERWKSPDHASEGEPPAAETERSAKPRPASPGRGLHSRSWRKDPAPRKKDDRPSASEAGFSEEEFTGVVRRPGPDDSERGASASDARAAAPEDEGSEVGDTEAGDRGAATLRTSPETADAGRETGASAGAPAPETGAAADPDEDSGASKKPAPAGRGSGRKRKAGRAERPAEMSDDGAPGDPEVADGAPAGSTDDAWYSAEFAEAVWGSLPFALEDPEPSLEGEEVGKESAPAPGRRGRVRSEKGAPSRATKRGSTGTPRFELVPPFETEPVEEAEEGSLAWLVSLIGETLARSRALDERERTAGSDARAAEEADTEVEDPVAREAGETATAAAPSPETGEEAATAGRGDEPSVVDDALAGADEPPSGRPSRPVREPGRARPPLATPTAKRRKTYVSASENPEVDPEAEIPVVLFHDRRPWRPSQRLLRIAATIAFLVFGTLALRALGSRGPGMPPPAPAAGPPALTEAGRPTPEFVDLADAYLSGLQGYRERLVQHGLGQVDCERLTADFSVVVLSHRALARYVAGTPSMADRFARLDAEIEPARQRFEASGCPLPTELAPAPTPEDPTAPISSAN